MSKTDAFKAEQAEWTAKRARHTEIVALKRGWVMDSENTAEEHLAIQRGLKDAYYAREAERRAA